MCHVLVSHLYIWSKPNDGPNGLEYNVRSSMVPILFFIENSTDRLFIFTENNICRLEADKRSSAYVRK